MILPKKTVIVALGLLWVLMSPSVAAGDGDTKLVMQQIFQNMRNLLPLSANQTRFSKPAHRELIRSSLDEIAASALTLERHARDQSDDAGTEFLAIGLKRAALDAQRSFDEGRLIQSRSMIWNTTRLCVACHTRLPSRLDPPVARDFLDDFELDELSLHERAQVLLATRQFDRSLDALKALLESDQQTAVTLIQPLTDYLIVSVRVKNDLRRPGPVLAQFTKRRDVWAALKEDVNSWIARLDELGGAELPAPSLAAATQFIDNARQSSIIPFSRRPMVDYVIASSLLQRHLEENRPRAEALARTYYLLGLTELGIGQSYELNQGEYYLEAAIRAAPGTSISAHAFNTLEEQIVMGYSGSAGTQVPEDVQLELDQLRALAIP